MEQMKKRFLIGLVCLSAAVASAQESELDAVKRQLKEATELFQKTMEQQRQVIESLGKKVSALEAQQAAVTNQPAASQIVRETVTNAPPVDGAAPAKRGWSP